MVMLHWEEHDCNQNRTTDVGTVVDKMVVDVRIPKVVIYYIKMVVWEIEENPDEN